jgi:hypothetical protein
MAFHEGIHYHKRSESTMSEGAAQQPRTAANISENRAYNVLATSAGCWAGGKSWSPPAWIRQVPDFQLATGQARIGAGQDVVGPGDFQFPAGAGQHWKRDENERANPGLQALRIG